VAPDEIVTVGADVYPSPADVNESDVTIFPGRIVYVRLQSVLL
jgi:hypothetical protein